jgi:multiple sugar transport system permease protein
MNQNPALNRQTTTGWLMTGPALLGLVLFVALPFLLAVGISFTSLRLASPLPARFVGFQQYARIFDSESFLYALRNNAFFALIVVPVQTGLALAVAMLLNQGLRGMAAYRALFFLPVIFPMALIAVVWELLYAPGAEGLLNSTLQTLTFGWWEPRDFLHDPALALPALMVLSIWQGLGFQMVILLAGLQSIPQQLYEAATIDGAGAWGRFRHVTLPGLRNPLIFVVLITCILAFRVFDQVQILTQGGPNDATTTVIYEAVKSAYSRQQVARACAMTVVFFGIVLAITLLQRWLIREEQHQG